MDFRDYYETLGVSKSASQDEIKRAFRTLARKYHSDVHPGDAGAERRLKEINEAHEVLGDRDKRWKYDELGANWRMYEQAGGTGARSVQSTILPDAVAGRGPLSLLAASLVVCLCGVVVYGNSLFFDYTYFDDQELVFSNQYFFADLRNVGALFMDDMWRFTEDTYYRPLYMLTYMLDFQFTGSDLFGFHFTSVVVHLLSAVLLLILFRQLRFGQTLSLWGAVLFVVHPVHVQGVSWIPGRNDSLLGLSVIVATLAWVSYWRQPTRKRWLVQATTFFAAILIKEPAFVLPPLFLALVWAREPDFWDRLRERFMPLALGWGVTAATWFLLRWLAFDNPAPVVPRLLDNLGVAGLVMLHYFGKTVFPVALRTVADLNAPWWPGVVVLALVAAVVVRVEDRRLLWVGLVWFVLMVFPTLLSGHSFYLEERLYAPLVGLSFFLLHALQVTRAHTVMAGRAVLSAVVVVFVIAAFNRSQQFSDRWTLWESAVEQSPASAFAANNLASIYFLDGQYENAREQYERALSLDREEPMVRSNLGLVHYQLEQFDLARGYFEEEIRRNPWYAESHYNLGILWSRLGRLDDAVREWERAIEVDPDYALPHEILARYYQDRDPERYAHYLGQLSRLGVPAPQ